MRNDPELIALSSTQRAVEEAEHVAWLAASLGAHDRRVLIVEDGAVSRIGYARLDLLDPSAAEVTVVLAAPNRGQGHGVAVMHAVSECGFGAWPELRHVVAFIRSENMASVRAFKKAGFRQTVQWSRDGHAVYAVERGAA
ncbi:MAG: GNAT family N-acetyltransferase [Phycisphaerales bacterium]|nr:GNAT family N-acetyltransferase [Phycisphaerales bacterium]